MFSEMVADLRENRIPDHSALCKRFDFAMTKKIGILKLPPAFWMQDPKINPRAEHLLWASLLLKDRERIDLALSVIAAEREENGRPWRGENGKGRNSQVQEVVEELFLQFSDVEERKRLRRELSKIAPELVVTKA